MGAEPNKVRRDALEFDHHHADVLGALGNFEAEKFFDGEAIDQIVAERTEIVHPVGEGDGLRIGFVFAGFFDAGVEVAEVGYGFNDRFTV